MTSAVAKIVGLGELLWDVFPDETRPGGATANFAFHAQQLGCRGIVASRVGIDAEGDGLIAFLQEKGLETGFIQRDSQHRTGWVSVTLSAAGQPQYVIHENVAWDFLELDPTLRQIMAAADAVCFGTLAQRSPVSRATIQQTLHLTRPDCLRVCDINIRQHYYDRECVEASLRRARLLKLNDEEVNILGPLLSLPTDPVEFSRAVMHTYGADIVCITRGANGCLAVDADEAFDIPGETVQVADTVGAGDSFTAGLVVTLLDGWPLDRAARFANKVGGLVASRRGAMPELREEFSDLKAEFAH